MERNQILELLQANVCNVVFNKVSGERRYMRCTLNSNHLPPVVIEQSKKDSTRSTQAIAVYDLDISDWRSFRIDHMVSIDPVA